MQTTLLVGGTLVQLDPLRVTESDMVLFEGQIGDLADEIPTTSSIDCTGCLIMPGFVVGHTHFYSALARGMPGPTEAPRTFREILERVWWRLDRALDAESLQASARVAAIEAVKAGATCVFDHHESPNLIDGSLDLIAEALDEVGLRGVLTYGATNRHGEDGALAGLSESGRFAKKTKDSPLVRGMIGLHAPFTCSDDTLDRAAKLSEELDLPLHFHAAEGPDDQLDAGSRWGRRLVLELHERGLLKSGSLLAHCVDVTDEEAEVLDANGVWVAHQARSNMNNSVGYASSIVGKLERLALGTDGIDQNMLAELKAAFFRNREAGGPSVWPDPARLLSGASRMAAERFGVDLGRLSPGAPADLVVLSYDAPTPLDETTAGSHLIFGLSSLTVRDVFIGGRPVVRNRKVITVDEGEVAARARKVAPRLWARM